jgi:PAS domain S-box-containing protein
VPGSLIDMAGLKVSAEDFLGAVLETTAQPIWVVDPDDRIRFANPAAIEALGYDHADELFGRHSHETIHYQHPDGTPYPASDCPMGLPRATGERVSNDLDWFFRRDGSRFAVSYLSVPIEMPEGRGAVVAFTDIDDRMRTERSLREHEAVLAKDQASLRRVARLVAGGASSADVFSAIAAEVGQVIGLPLIVVWRYEPDAATVIGAWSEHPHPFRAGTRWLIDGPTINALVRETRRPARIDDFANIPGEVADAARKAGIHACAGAPIVVDGDVWGVMSADSMDRAPLADQVEDRLAEFTELIAAAIANSARRDELARLADEQAGLRRVATLVAQGVPKIELFDAVTHEAGGLLGADLAGMIRYVNDDAVTAVATWAAHGEHPEVRGVWPLEGDRLASTILKTRRPAREDDWADVSGPIAAFVREQLGINSSVGSPVVVEGTVWGALFVHSTHGEPLPAGTEARLTDFTELLATAISNSEARAEVRRLADEQAALWRVARLVAEAVSPSDLFGAVAEEVGSLLGADFAGMIRYEDDGTVTPAATWAAAGRHPPVPDSWTTEPGDPVTQVFETRRPARIDDWVDVPGPIAAFVREELGVRSSVGSPIFAEGRLWGALAVHLKGVEPLPADTESRLLNFTELVATAISNSEARAEVQRLADEQTALRRVATLVARESPPDTVFAAVAEELGRLLQVDATRLVRFESDDMATVMAMWGQPTGAVPVGTRMPLGGRNVISLVSKTGRPARMDDYSEATGEIAEFGRRLEARSAVGGPIVVAGRLWGAMVVISRRAEPMPAGTEERIKEFAELIATAVANIQARSDLAASRARIVAAADDERQRVVRDLHDGAQQRLVHTVITLKLARQALAQEDETAPELMAEALQQAEAATGELRELAHGILPSILTHGGLRAAVEALAVRMPVRVDIDVSVRRLPAPVEATAYFVVAEALTNVAKHAQANRATVVARLADGQLCVDVRDDGAGGARPDGTGLVGLTDRLSVLNGRLRVESPADGGTLVAATIPVLEDDHAGAVLPT